MLSVKKLKPKFPLPLELPSKPTHVNIYNTLIKLNIFLIIFLEGDMIGEAYNSDDKQDVVAVTYGIASDGGNNLPDVTGYRLP